MKVDKKSMLLYAVTDRMWLNGQTLAECVEKCLCGGVTFLQLREKDLPYDEFLSEAIQIKKLTDKYNVPFVINDNIDIAIECGADGVHVGQDDMSVLDARLKIGCEKILGVSVHNVDEAVLAEKNGADYLGVGAMFSTSTKKDADNVDFQTLKNICDSVSIPVVAIGGISKDNIIYLKNSGVDGFAVVSAIFAQDDIQKATESLKCVCRGIVK